MDHLWRSASEVAFGTNVPQCWPELLITWSREFRWVTLSYLFLFHPFQINWSVGKSIASFQPSGNLGGRYRGRETTGWQPWEFLIELLIHAVFLFLLVINIGDTYSKPLFGRTSFEVWLWNYWKLKFHWNFVALLTATTNPQNASVQVFVISPTNHVSPFHCPTLSLILSWS